MDGDSRHGMEVEEPGVAVEELCPTSETDRAARELLSMGLGNYSRLVTSPVVQSN